MAHQLHLLVIGTDMKRQITYGLLAGIAFVGLSFFSAYAQNPCDDGNACTTDSLDSKLGCLHAPVAVGTPCNDGNACEMPPGHSDYENYKCPSTCVSAEACLPCSSFSRDS